MEGSPNVRNLRGHKVMLDAEEVEALRSQSMISNAPGRGARRYAPYAFTVQGVAMPCTVLRRLSSDHRDDGTACASRVDAL